MNKNIIIGAGGTGGHLAPALAISQELSKKKYKVTLYTEPRCKKYLVQTNNYKIIISNNRHRPSKNPWQLIKAIFALIKEVFFLLRKIYQDKIDLVISFGGYSSCAINIAAILSNRKLIIHEQNSVLGLQNRIVARFADYVAYSFPKTKGIEKIHHKKLSNTGIPVDMVLYKQGNIEEKNKKFTIVIIGGSQGAKFLDKNITKLIENLDSNIRDNLSIIQQVRAEQYEQVVATYKELNLNFKVQTYFDNITTYLAQADLVVSRSGAGSLAEITCLKKAAILIPYPYAKDNHQYFNASFFIENNAAMMIEEGNFELADLEQKILLLINNNNIKKRLESNISKIGDFANNKKFISLIEKL